MHVCLTFTIQWPARAAASQQGHAHLSAAASRYSGTAGRTNKPFNPLLGETYELVCAEKGFRMLAEKVPALRRLLLLYPNTNSNPNHAEKGFD